MPKQNGGARAHGLLKLVAVALSLIALVAPVYADTTTFAIDPQDLSGALKAFAVQSHREIFFAPELARGRKSKGVKGKYDDLRALNIILEGTGLNFSVTTSDAILVRDPTNKSDSSRASITPATSANTDPPDSSIRMTQAGSPHIQRAEGSNTAAAESAVSSGAERPGLTEIIVTAQKKSERLQDVPVPVMVIGADPLVANGKPLLQDYYDTVPGLNLAPGTQSNKALSIRGITTGGGGNPTVGVTIDDVPFGSSANLGGGQVVPDIDPGDLARIEVLRGPQGTLYGASSMGGLLKFVTVDPSTDAVSGQVQAGTSNVYNGAEWGYNFRGSVNMPLTDTVAIRASGFTRQDPGYIDDPTLHLHGVNEDHANGGRLAALWRPSEAFSLKVSALYQDIKGDASSDVDRPTAGFPSTTGLGDLQQSYLPGTGGYERQVQAYSAILNAKWGGIDLTSVSGYNINSYSDSSDYSYQFPDSTLSDVNRTNKYTQEFRLSSPLGQRIDWLLGVFYTHEGSEYGENLRAQNPLTGAELLDISFPTTYEEYAGFTDLTFRIADRFDVQLGGRESQIRQTFSQTELLGAAFGGGNVLTPEEKSKENSFTYLLTPRFKLSSDTMLYARFASGYRAGGTNAVESAGTPSQYDPDKTENYEIGFKGDFLEHRLTVDTSLYYIDWKDIQVQLHDSNGFGYTANGGTAKSQGVEFSLESRPGAGLKLGGWVVWDDAVLTQDFPTNSGVSALSGDRLPNGSRFSGDVSVDQDFALWTRMTGFWGADLNYIGDRKGIFVPSTSVRQDLPSYSRLDLHAGAKYGPWSGNLYANNVANRRGVLNGGVGQFPPFAFTYIQPRTIGLTLSRQF